MPLDQRMDKKNVYFTLALNSPAQGCVSLMPAFQHLWFLYNPDILAIPVLVSWSLGSRLAPLLDISWLIFSPCLPLLFSPQPSSHKQSSLGPSRCSGCVFNDIYKPSLPPPWSSHVLFFKFNYTWLGVGSQLNWRKMSINIIQMQPKKATRVPNSMNELVPGMRQIARGWCSGWDADGMGIRWTTDIREEQLFPRLPLPDLWRLFWDWI